MTGRSAAQPEPKLTTPITRSAPVGPSATSGAPESPTQVSSGPAAGADLVGAGRRAADAEPRGAGRRRDQPHRRLAQPVGQLRGERAGRARRASARAALRRSCRSRARSPAPGRRGPARRDVGDQRPGRPRRADQGDVIVLALRIVARDGRRSARPRPAPRRGTSRASPRRPRPQRPARRSARRRGVWKQWAAVRIQSRRDQGAGAEIDALAAGASATRRRHRDSGRCRPWAPPAAARAAAAAARSSGRARRPRQPALLLAAEIDRDDIGAVLDRLGGRRIVLRLLMLVERRRPRPGRGTAARNRPPDRRSR